MPLNLSQPILYLITRGATTEATTTVDSEFAQILDQVSAAVAAGIDLVQIREKQLTARILFELVSEAARVSRGTKTRLLVNDRADIAAGAGAHGVHLTTQSLNPATIRKAFGDDFLIGASTHSLDEARQARDKGADFAVFGPVFYTVSKQEFGPPQGLKALSLVARELSSFPVLALGGISKANAADCFAAGAYGVAGIGLFSEPEHFISLCTTIREAAKEHE
jgi:thiamine-phosphate pyrophosphorylase